MATAREVLTEAAPDRMTPAPIMYDLFCGLGGGTEGALSEGYTCYGFDIERHQYGEHRYPAQLILQDILTMHGSQLKDAAYIWASPPCQRYSYMAQPWSRAKREIQWQEWERDSPFGHFTLNDLFNACFRIQREASEAAGHHIPMVVENVVGAQRWIGRAQWHYGSFYLWGDVPAIMPFTNQRESDAIKNPGLSWSGYGDPNYKAVGFNVRSAQRFRESGAIKQHGSGPAWFDKALDERRKEATAVKVSGDWFGTYQEMKEAGTISPTRTTGNHTNSRKAASALIAKIPFELSSYIARVFKP